jgi:hypothetical protein
LVTKAPRLSKNTRRLVMQENIAAYLFLLPFLVFFVGFVLYPMFMCIAHKPAILLVSAHTRINAVIIGDGISVIGTRRHVILQYRCMPNCRHTQVSKIVEMFIHSCNVTTMTGIRKF